MSVQSAIPFGALVLGAALALGSAALPAFATDTNQPATWQTLPGESCDDVGYTTSDSVANPYRLPDAEDGRTWSKVIVKAGSTGHSVTDENTVYTTGLDVGAAFVHAEKNSISHVIVCSVPGATPGGDSEGEDPESEDPESEDPETEDPETEDPETEDPDSEDPDSEDPETEDPDTDGPEDPETQNPGVAEASITVLAATCEAGGSVELGAVVSATWGALAVSPSFAAGAASFSVAATATEGNVFAPGEGVSSDRATRTFTGSVAEQLAADDPSCSRLAQPEPITRLATSETVECAANSVTVVTTTYTTPFVFDEGSGTWVPGTERAGEPVITYRDPTMTELTETCGFVDTDPEASQCFQSNPRSPYTSWIRVDLDPRVIYRIDGAVVTTEFTAVSEGTRVVTAAAAPGYVLLPGAVTSWTYDVVDSAACQLETLALPGREAIVTTTQLETLALTGTDAVRTGTLGLAGVLAGLAGMLFAAGARAERRERTARQR